MMLQFQDPAKLKTKRIVFEDVYTARDSATLEQLKELSSRRKVIEEFTNESSSITEAIAREMSGGLTSHCQRNIQKLENYIPMLENLVFCVGSISSNRQIAQQTAQLRIRWSSLLSSSSLLKLRGPKFYQIDDLSFELSMTLFLYGAMLRERALEVLSTDLVESATLFRAAAGVYHHLAQEVLPFLQTKFSTELPPEATSFVSNAMSLICLAEAQAVTIRKAEEKGTTESLLAKLHYGVKQLLDEATGVLCSRTGQCQDISLRFQEFMDSCKDLHELRSRRYLAGSLRTAGQYGVAIGVLRDALINVKEKIPGEQSWKSVFRKEIDAVAGILKKFEHENEFVWHERIPFSDQLPSPEGNKIVSIIKYQPKRWERELAFKV